MASPFDLSRMDRDRLAKGWTRYQLAEKADVAGGTLSNFFRGRNRSPKTAAKIAAALGHDLERYVPESPVAEAQLTGVEP